MRTKIVIADDHQIVIDGLKSILDGDESVEIVGEALDGEEALRLARLREPDLMIIDINMPKIDGVEATKKIRDQHPDMKVLILTMYNTANFIKNMAEAGAHGFILKNTGRDELKIAIELLMEGHTYYGQEVTKTLMDSYSKKATENVIKLTNRELEVLKLLADGLTTPEISEKLFIAVYTVETHRKNLLSKCHQKTSAGLVKFAIEMELLSSGNQQFT